MGFGRELTLFSAIQSFDLIKSRAVLHKDCTERNDILKGNIWRLPHSTGCVIEYGESHCREINQCEA